MISIDLGLMNSHALKLNISSLQAFCSKFVISMPELMMTTLSVLLYKLLKAPSKTTGDIIQQFSQAE